MIHLCYPKQRFFNPHWSKFQKDLYPRLKENDLVLFPNNIYMSTEKWNLHSDAVCKFSSDTKIDLEKLAGQDIKNIIICNWEQFEADVFRSIIALKSIKSEIIGITNSFVEFMRDTFVEIEHYKDIGFSNDEIAVMLILKENRPPEFIKECVEKTCRFKNQKYKQIETVEDVIKLLKY